MSSKRASKGHVPGTVLSWRGKELKDRQEGAELEREAAANRVEPGGLDEEDECGSLEGQESATRWRLPWIHRWECTNSVIFSLVLKL